VQEALSVSRVMLSRRSAALAAVLSCFAVVLPACDDAASSTQSGAVGEVRPRSLDDLAREEDDAAMSSAAADLAAQFERDAAALRSLRGDAGALDRSDGAASPPAAPRRGVVFNDPPRQTPGPRTAPANDSSATQGSGTSASGGADGAASDLPDVLTADASTAPPEVRLREAMVALRRELYQTASYDDAPLRQYLAMSALAMIDPERALDPDALVDLDPRERDLLRAYQQFFINLGKELTSSGDDERLLSLIDELKQTVSNRGPLTIARAEFCTRVDGFGRFRPFSRNAFLAGSGQQVVIYTEIDEFSSARNAEGQWVTDLSQELSIYNTHDNIPVWRLDWQPATDVSATKLSDFFITHLITIPERLGVGRYTMKVRVRDEAAGSIAEAGIEFQIVADENLAAKIE
jgi:hypothetical protein